MFQASLCQSSEAQGRMLLRMVFSTECAGWNLEKPGNRPCAQCRGCYSTSRRFAYSLRARKLSANLYDINHSCVYSEKFLMMDRGTVRNMWSLIPKINLRH